MYAWVSQVFSKNTDPSKHGTQVAEQPNFLTPGQTIIFFKHGRWESDLSRKRYIIAKASIKRPLKKRPP